MFKDKSTQIQLLFYSFEVHKRIISVFERLEKIGLGQEIIFEEIEGKIKKSESKE